MAIEQRLFDAIQSLEVGLQWQSISVIFEFQDLSSVFGMLFLFSVVLLNKKKVKISFKEYSKLLFVYNNAC